MFPPSRLLRSNSSANHAFVAPRNAINNEVANFTCGLSAFPRLNKFLKLEKFATTFSFYMVLCGGFALNGIAFTYIKETSPFWSHQFGILTYQWLIYAPFIFAGALSVFVGYFGNKLERPSCIGAFFIFTSVAAIILIVVEFHNKIPETSDNLCRSEAVKPELAEIGYIALLTFQFFEGFTYASLITNGITYIDDHLKLKYGALFLSVLYAFYKIGMQLGIMMSLITIHLEHKTFSSILWIIFTVFTFLLGLLIMMFPKILPSKITQQGVATILDRNIVVAAKEKDTDGFCTMALKIWSWRVGFAILAASLMEIATSNYELIQRDTYRKKKKFFSTYSNPYLAMLYSHFITIPSEIFAILIIGIIIYKFKIRPRKLCSYICVTYIIVAISFAVSSLSKCRVDIFNDNRDLQSFFNLNCKCGMDRFQPVCIREYNTTFYSPCFAGCQAKEGNVYSKCKSGYQAEEGICNQENCLYTWIIEELDKVNRKMLLASSKIIYPLIVLRSVPEPYKAVALGFYIMGTKLLPYIPINLFYYLLEVSFCYKWDSKNNCGIYNHNFPIYLNSITTGIMALAILMVVLLLIFVKKLDLYSETHQLIQESRSRTVLPKTITEESENEESSDDENNTVVSNYNSDLSANPKPIKEGQDIANNGEEELLFGVRRISNNELTTLIPAGTIKSNRDENKIAHSMEDFNQINSVNDTLSTDTNTNNKIIPEDHEFRNNGKFSSNSDVIITETPRIKVNLNLGKPKRKETSF